MLSTAFEAFVCARVQKMHPKNSEGFHMHAKATYKWIGKLNFQPRGQCCSCMHALTLRTTYTKGWMHALPHAFCKIEIACMLFHLHVFARSRLHACMQLHACMKPRCRCMAPRMAPRCRCTKSFQESSRAGIIRVLIWYPTQILLKINVANPTTSKVWQISFRQRFIN